MLLFEPIFSAPLWCFRIVEGFCRGDAFETHRYPVIMFWLSGNHVLLIFKSDSLTKVLSRIMHYLYLELST